MRQPTATAPRAGVIESIRAIDGLQTVRYGPEMNDIENLRGITRAADARVGDRALLVFETTPSSSLWYGRKIGRKGVDAQQLRAIFEARGGTPCSSCAHPIETGFYITKARPWVCFGCDFWLDYVLGVHPSDRAPVDPLRVVRIKGEQHFIHDDKSLGSGLVGYGGARFVVHFTDGRVVETRNLWSQGTIPERFRDRLPDNAIHIEGMSI